MSTKDPLDELVDVMRKQQRELEEYCAHGEWRGPVWEYHGPARPCEQMRAGDSLCKQPATHKIQHVSVEFAQYACRAHISEVGLGYKNASHYTLNVPGDPIPGTNLRWPTDTVRQ
jgi:hypothetical protein